MTRLARMPLGLALLLMPAGVASAQFYGDSGVTYGTADCNCVQPISTACVCAQPVQQVTTAAYQTVPVTEYQTVERTVQRPIVETKYVEQPVTQYVPVTEQRTVEVPTVSYQNVCECRTVTRDLGGWQTSYQQVHKVTPCEYDRRPNMLGWWNRTTYGIRQSFTPNVIARRQYVPNVVAQNIPYTRQVAIHGTRQVTYNVTKMVAQQTTRKVAVNTVRYVAEKQTVSVPVTVMRTIPIGTATAFLPLGASATALVPTPDVIGTKPDAKRTAESTDDTDDGRFRRGDDEFDGRTGSLERRANTGNTSTTIPARRPTAPAFPQARRPITPAPDAVAQTNHWVPRAKSQPEPRPQQDGPTLVGPSLAASH
jgi:hypothetical protein